MPQIPDEFESKAFRMAVLRSEWRRIIGIIGLLSVLAVLVVIRTVLSGAGVTEDMSFIVGSGAAAMALGLILVGVGYELLMLRLIRRTIREERDIPAWVWPINIVFETMLPTLSVLMLAHLGLTSGYRALVAPTVFIYFFFIILSSLRLLPWLCLFTGAVSAVSYAAVIAYIYYRFPDPDNTQSVFPVVVHITAVIMMGFAGVIAWFVTREVRTHVAAALREAEARNRAERMEHDLDIARSIQQGLLPTASPNVPGYDIAAWNRPADQTGGDYYDWQALPGGMLAVSLADVTGHGVGPALVAAVCRAYTRASMPTDADLEPVLSRINELLFEDLPDNRFVTFVVAVLSDSSPSLQLLSAGHAPLYFYEAAEDTIHAFDAQDIPLGIASGMSYGPVKTLDMKPGDTLVLLTDGFFEWANPGGKMFGTERLGQAIRAANALPACELIQQIKETVESFANGTSQADDLTAVVIKRG
jgi:serine phosphatase RsbU (regulator of sigma subunit)